MRQLSSYRDDAARFEAAGAVVLGISPQGLDSHERFATQYGLPFALLADTDKRVVEQYGVGAPLIGVRRSVFAIDQQGVVRFADRKLLGAMFVRAAALEPVLERM